MANFSGVSLCDVTSAPVALALPGFFAEAMPTTSLAGKGLTCPEEEENEHEDRLWGMQHE